MRKLPYPNSPHTNLYSKYIKYDGIKEVTVKQEKICNNSIITVKENNIITVTTYNVFKAKVRRGGLERSAHK